MERVLNSTDSIAELQATGTKIALKRASVPYMVPYNNGGKVSLGEYSFSVPQCHSADEFAQEFNKNSIVKAQFNGTHWKVRPKKNIYGVSGSLINTYEDQHGNQRRLEFRDSKYWLVDEKSLDLSVDYFYWKAGQLIDTSEYKPITSVNAITKVRFENTVALSGTQLTFGGVNTSASDAQYISLDHKLSIGGEEQHETITLDTGDHYVSEQGFPGRFILKLHGLGEGFIMQSCVISVIKKHIDVPMFSFRIRAGQLIDLVNCTKNVEIPAKTQKLFIEQMSNQISVWSDDGVSLVKIIQGDVDVQSDCRLCLSALAPIEFPTPQYQTIKALANTKGSLCFGMKAANSNVYTIFESNLFKIVVQADILLVNGVSTGITISTLVTYVVSASFVDTQIEASVLNLALGSVAQYASTAAEGSFVSQSSYSSNFASTVATGFELCGLIMAYDNSDEIENNLLHEIIQCWSGREQDLGTFDGTDFQNGSASWVSDKLTVAGIVYTRIVPELNNELRQLFGVQSEVSGALEGVGYTNRIAQTLVRAVGIGVRGFSGNVIFSGKTDQGKIECEPEWFSFIFPGHCVLIPSYIDAQNGVEKQFDSHESSYTILLK